MTPCSLVGVYQQFVATYAPHFTAKSAVKMIHNLLQHMNVHLSRKIRSPVRYLNVFYSRTVHINAVVAGNGNSRTFVFNKYALMLHISCVHCLNIVYTINITFVSAGVYGSCEYVE